MDGLRLFFMQPSSLTEPLDARDTASSIAKKILNLQFSYFYPIVPKGKGNTTRTSGITHFYKNQLITFSKNFMLGVRNLFCLQNFSLLIGCMFVLLYQ